MSSTLDYKNYSKRMLSRNRVRRGYDNYSNDHVSAPFHPSLLMRFSGHRQRVLCVDVQESLSTSSEKMQLVQEEYREIKEVEQVSCAPKVFSSGADGACMLWDVRPNMRALRFTTHTAYIHSCAFAPWRVNAINNYNNNSSSNISYLACCGHDGYVRLWIPTGRSAQSRLSYPIRSGILLDDCTNDAQVYNTYCDIDMNTTETNNVLNQSCEEDNDSSLQNNWYNNYNKGNRENVKWNKSCRVNSREEGQLHRPINNSNNRLSINHNYDIVNHKNANSVFRNIWPNREPEVSVCMWKAHAGATRAIAFAQDGSSHLYTAGDDKSVKCWDVEYSTGTSASTPLTSLCFVPSADDKQTRVPWCYQSHDTANSINSPLYRNEEEQNTKVNVRSNNYSNSCNQEKAHTSRAKLGKVNIKRENVNHLSGTRNGRLLGARFVGGFSANISEVPYQSFLNAQICSGDFNKFSVTAHTNWVRCLAVQSPFTSHSYFHYLASGGDDSVIHVWDIRSRKLAHVFYETDCGIRSLAFAPNGYHLASGDVEGHINVFDLRYTNTNTTNNKNAKYGLVQRYEQAHAGVVNSISFAPNGSWLLSAGDDAECKLWDVEEGYLYCTVQAHRSPVTSCKFSDDGQFFVTGGDDGAVLLWNSGIPHMTRPPVTSAIQDSHEHTLESNFNVNDDVVSNKNKETVKLHKAHNHSNNHITNSMSFDNCRISNDKGIINSNSVNNSNAKCSRAEEIINSNIARVQRGRLVPKQANRAANMQYVMNKLQHEHKSRSPEMRLSKTAIETANEKENINASFYETEKSNNQEEEANNMLQRDDIADALADNNTNKSKKRSESERRSFTRSEERYSHLGHEIPLDENNLDVREHRIADSRERVTEAFNTSKRNDVNVYSDDNNDKTAVKTEDENTLESTSSENSNSNKRQHESIVKESKVTSQSETCAHDSDDTGTERNSSSKNDSHSSTSRNSKTSFIQSAHKLQQIHETLFTIRQLITEQRDDGEGEEINENVDAQFIEELKQLMNDVMEQQRLYVNQLEKRRKEEEL